MITKLLPIIAAVSSTAYGATLAEYAFTSGTDAATTTEAGITASSVSGGVNQFSNLVYTDNQGYANGGQTAFTFTFTTAGTDATYEEFNFDLGSASSATATYAVSYIDGGVETFIVGSSSSYISTGNVLELSTVLIDFNDFTSSGTVTWNIYGTISASNRAFRTDNYEVIGTIPVTVPEPTSSALLGLGGLALVTRRKR